MKTRKELATHNGKLAKFAKSQQGYAVLRIVEFVMISVVIFLFITAATAKAAQVYTEYQLGKEAGRLESKIGVIEHEELPQIESEIAQMYKNIETLKETRTERSRVLEIAKCKLNVVDQERSMEYERCDKLGQIVPLGKK